MEVRIVTTTGIEQHPLSALGLDGTWRGHPPTGDDPLWVDIPVGDDGNGDLLSAMFGFHPSAIADCARRNRVPRVDAYHDHVFVVLHAPELGAGGHVHFVEIDQFVAVHYLVTIHGPVNPAVDPKVAHRETEAVLTRLTTGRLHPSSGFELSHAIVCAVIGGQEQLVESLTRQVWDLEQQVTGGHLCDPEHLLDELFRVRHGLLAIRTMSASGRDVYARMARLATVVPECAFLTTPAPATTRPVNVLLAPRRQATEQETERWRSAPVACSLTGSGMAERAATWREALEGATRTKIPGGVRLTLPTDRAAQLAALAADEHRCCPFFDFRLHLDGHLLHLEIRAPADGTGLLTELFGPPA